MNRFDTFVATVGVLLLENVSGLPWQASVPPALARGRGWHLPVRGGSNILMVVRADGLDAQALTDVAGQWESWLEGLRAGDSALILVTAGPLAEGGSPFLLSPGTRWPIWLVDLSASEPPAPEGTEGRAFLEQAFDGVAAYFQGVHHTVEDLQDAEQANLAGKTPFSTFMNAQHAPATWMLLAALALFYGVELALGGTTNYKMLRAGAINAPLIEQGELWRLISAGFLHFNLIHLGVNAMGLLAVGPYLEKLFGTRKFLAIYLVSGLTGGVASYWFNHNGISAGASGALSGLLGAMLVLGLRYRGALPVYQRRALGQAGLIMVALTIGLGLAIPHIDNSAHMGGLAGGLLLAALVGPHPTLLGRRPSRWAERLLLLAPVLTAIGLLASLGYALSGRLPDMETEAPTNDFVARVPLDKIQFNGRALDVSADHDQHWVRLESVENWAGLPTPDRRPLLENNLEVHANMLAARYATMGARLSGAPTVVLAGHHRFLRIALLLPDGTHEEVYITANQSRIYAIRTFGLETQPWVAPMLTRALTTFEMKVGHPN